MKFTSEQVQPLIPLKQEKKKQEKNPYFCKAFMLVSSAKPVDLFVLSLGKVSVFPGIQNSHCPKVRQI